MKGSAKRELESIKRELQNIVNDLNDISSGVRNDFKGIGNDKCANAITQVSDHYRSVIRQLNKID